ncbi:cell division protein FtsB [Gammaproteobacteria bacterium]|jgi:cell division protein FtsB|nr:cell division protein FtsB [Pseudomonadota bacterium]MDB0064348.1 cell division protein FtsB [Gammaproteobacteria bacterium]
MRIFLLFLLIVLVLLQYQLWIAPDGMRAVMQLKQDMQVQQEKNNVLAVRNQVLAAEVQDLKSGNDAIEERARSELGMIRKGETFFQVIEKEQE